MLREFGQVVAYVLRLMFYVLRRDFQYPVSDRMGCNLDAQLQIREFATLSVSCVGSTGLQPGAGINMEMAVPSFSILCLI